MFKKFYYRVVIFTNILLEKLGFKEVLLPKGVQNTDKKHSLTADNIVLGLANIGKHPS